jgi:ferredoxin
MATVKIHFLPDNVTTFAQIGESWLDVAARAGVHISTGCLAGACQACEITLVKDHTAKAMDAAAMDAAATDAAATNLAEEPVLACLQSVPQGCQHIEVSLLNDPTW